MSETVRSRAELSVILLIVISVGLVAYLAAAQAVVMAEVAVSAALQVLMLQLLNVQVG